MKPWQDIALQLGSQNAAVGETLNINGVLQDSYTSEFLIDVEGVIGTAAATAAIEGLPAIISKVNISGPLAGWNALNPVNGLSGPMLVELGQFKRSNISYSWGALGTTGKFGVTIPCTFIMPRLRGAGLMFCLPTKNMGAVNFTVQMATQAQLDTNGTPTLAFTTLTVSVQQNEFKANSIPPMSPLVPASQVPQESWQFIPSQLNYVQNQNIQASQQVQQLLPNGTTTLVLMRSFPTTTGGVATSRQSDTVAGGPLDLTVTSQGITIEDVNQSPKLSVSYYKMRKQNLDSITDSLVAGNACFMFNQALAKIFQPIVGPNQIPINYATTLTGTTNPRIDFVYEQITDTQNWLGLL